MSNLSYGVPEGTTHRYGSVLYKFTDDAVFIWKGGRWAESPDKLEFRAIRTPAQIASEKRETAIRELMDIAQVDCRVTAARLVDAGFKREVV